MSRAYRCSLMTYSIYLSTLCCWFSGLVREYTSSSSRKAENKQLRTYKLHLRLVVFRNLERQLKNSDNCMFWFWALWLTEMADKLMIMQGILIISCTKVIHVEYSRNLNHMLRSKLQNPSLLYSVGHVIKNLFLMKTVEHVSGEQSFEMDPFQCKNCCKNL